VRLNDNTQADGPDLLRYFSTICLKYCNCNALKIRSVGGGKKSDAQKTKFY
jgi:hypothetical protein